MAAKSYSLNFEGYWREQHIGGLPAQSGIYGVYAATYNSSSDTVTLIRLIYLGEAENMRDRVKNHEKWSRWRGELRIGEELCFNAALIGQAEDRKRAEAAMIYEHKPPCNEEYVHNFPFDTTTITTLGRNALMVSYFTVHPTPGSYGLGALAGFGTRRW